MFHGNFDSIDVSILSAAIAFAAATLSAYFSHRTLQNVRLNQFFQTVAARDQYFSRLRLWADDAIDLLALAVHLCDLDPNKLPDGEFFTKRHDLRVRLSSMVDKGRWFFPNVAIDRHGSYKEEAYRGFRQDVLNSLISAYRSVGALDYTSRAGHAERRDELVASQRRFTTEIQRVLDPRKREEEFTRLMALVGNP